MEIAPARIPASEVCRLAGYGRVTLGRRIKEGKMPAPVDRGREQLFDRAAVHKALGIPSAAEQHAEPENDDPWGKAAHAIAERRTAALHRHKETA